jgi:hypothetical protein
MKTDNISAMRISIYDCETTPADLIKPFIPKNYTRVAWIPQSMGDQVWVLFEFPSLEDRQSWECELTLELFNMLDRRLIKDAARFGWGVRDFNGFLVGE